MPIFSITLFMKQPPMHRIVTNAPGMNDPHIMTRCQKCLKLSHQSDYHEIATAAPTLFAPFSSIMARYKRVRSDLIIQAQLPCTKRALFCLKLLRFQIAGRLSRHISPNELLNWKMLQTCTVLGLRFFMCATRTSSETGQVHVGHFEGDESFTNFFFVCLCTAAELEQVHVRDFEAGGSFPDSLGLATAWG